MKKRFSFSDSTFSGAYGAMEESMSRLQRVILRPHHLLCTQSYEGKGYNKEFTEKMDDITNYLRNIDNAQVKVVFSTDDMCAKCQHMLKEDTCVSNEKVKTMDNKMTHYFEIAEQDYIYKDIVTKINAKLTPQILDDICGECQWYADSNCRKLAES